MSKETQKEIKEIRERIGTLFEKPGDLLRLNILEGLEDINYLSQ